MRKYKKIPVSTEKKHGKRYYIDSNKIFGETVFIFDETNSKVKVSTLTGTILWIPKYFLYKEITSQNNTSSITKEQLNEFVLELISLGNPDENKMKIINILKLYSDKL